MERASIIDDALVVCGTDRNEVRTQDTSRNDLWRLLASRFDGNRRTSKVASIRQCQVLVPYSGTLNSETEASIIALHLQTREAFRKKWLQHWQSLRSE